MKQDIAAPLRGKRPYLASKCDSLSDCEFWRRQIVKEIGVVSAGEFRSKNLLQDVHAAFLGMETSSPELQPLSALTGQ